MEDTQHHSLEAAKSSRENRLMKVDKNRIKSPPDVWEKYICPSCHYLLEEAVQSACGHRLCRSCAVEMFSKEENPTCLVTEDGEHLMIPEDADDDIDQKYFPDKFAQRDILKIKVVCPFPNCEEVVTMKNLKSHVLECKFAGEICTYCNEFIHVDKLENHELECPNMEKGCPFSEMAWKEDFDELLNETQRRDLKVKWKKALEKCTGKKFPKKMFQEHVQCNEDHLRTITGVTNVVMEIVAQLYKQQLSVRPTTSEVVEKDGGEKPLIKKANTLGVAAVIDGDDKPYYVMELEKQMMIIQTTVDGMRTDSIQSHKESVAVRNDLSHAMEQIKDLQAKVDFFEQKLSTREQQLEEKDFRISLLEAANYDGTMIWRISGFESRTKDARDARYTSIFSLPFYTNKYGYKMCLRLYPLGDGMGKNTHLSLFFVVMKSEYDSLLQWPFTNKVTLTLINQSGGPDVTDTFKPDPKSSSFQRPKTEMNVASGCPRFVPLDDLHRNGFIKDDTIFIKVKVESISTRY